MPSEIRLTGVTKTPLITLLAKAEESAMPDSLLCDRFAAAAISVVDEELAHLKVGHDMTVAIAMRALLLDRWTRAFLDRHPDATVLHLGCGLDARVFRVDPPPSVDWFDVDLPEVIALRQRIYPCRSNYATIAASITETAWLSQLPTDRPAISSPRVYCLILTSTRSLSFSAASSAASPPVRSSSMPIAD
jgi:O-methyltransferase involved in polyketide biosynthesis